MFRLADGEVSYLRNTVQDVLDLLRNGEDADVDTEEAIFAIEVAIDMLDSLNYHETQKELELIEDEEQDTEYNV